VQRRDAEWSRGAEVAEGAEFTENCYDIQRLSDCDTGDCDTGDCDIFVR
jgi:hypothetical protein